ncbi:MAG: UvrB/UvrC motif-containing protein [Longimicrobiales bacterium]|nr:UvrB/UvrC motif-containing protein [Longimicrobiales bacterium]
MLGKHPATQCELCKASAAVVHVTQITEEKILTSHFCKECAANKGISHFDKSIKTSLHDFLIELGNEPDSPIALDVQTTCSFCGMKIGEFQRTGRLGCPHCYTDFDSYLKRILKKIHGSAGHTGKVYLPPNPNSYQLEQKMQFLKNGMTRAVEREEFEKAAILRDEIGKMKSETNGGQ